MKDETTDQPTTVKPDAEDTKDSHLSCQYDFPEIQLFLKLIFQPEKFHPTAEPLFWATKKSGAIGTPLAGGLNALQKKTLAGKPHGMYFNTSTFIRDIDSGYLNHQHKNFGAMHVVVCDDVGTKVDVDKFKNMKPTYIIETSEGNYQYGFVLIEPVFDLEQAGAIVQCASLAGVTDSGGVMAGKLVRLPCGVNGKKGTPKEHFPVRLKRMDGPKWTAEDFVNALELTVEGKAFTWEHVSAGEQPGKTKNRTKFMARPPTHLNTANVQDMVLDWLDDSDLVLGDHGGDWIDIECPWCEFHTDGNDTAGYSPLGRGDRPEMRAFNCFHEHCKTNKTVEFLEHFLMNSDCYEIAMFEPININPRDLILYAPENRVYDISGVPCEYKMDGFKTKFNAPVTVLRSKGSKFSWERTNEASYWLNSPYRIVVDRIVSDAGEPKLFKRDHTITLNLFQPPPWTDGKWDPELVKPFEEHLSYLLPNDEEYEYVLQWLAAKCTDWSFRGTALVMRTTAQGVGRNTLGNMVAEIVGAHNAVPDISFDDFLGSAWTDWQDSLLVCVSEAINTQQGQTSRYKAYDALKQKIDTSNVAITINPKGKSQYTVKSASSTMIFSNHLDAITMTGGDRRLTVLTNPEKPRDALYYSDLRQFMRDNPEWPEHVYRWLKEQPFDLNVLSLPLETEGKKIMVAASEPELKRVMRYCDEYLEANDIEYYSVHMIEQTVTSIMDFDTKENINYWRRSLNEFGIAWPHSLNFNPRINGLKTRPRIRKAVFAENPDIMATKPGPNLQDTIRTSIESIDEAALLEYVKDCMLE